VTLKEYVTVVGVENYFKGVTGRKPQPLKTSSVPVFVNKTKDKVEDSVYRKTSGPNIDEMKREISNLTKENRELGDVNSCLTETVSRLQKGRPIIGPDFFTNVWKLGCMGYVCYVVAEHFELLSILW
jgi:hypothetical protein